MRVDGHPEQLGGHLQRGRVQQHRVELLGRGVPVDEGPDADQVAAGLGLPAGDGEGGCLEGGEFDFGKLLIIRYYIILWRRIIACRSIEVSCTFIAFFDFFKQFSETSNNDYSF